VLVRKLGVAMRKPGTRREVVFWPGRGCQTWLMPATHSHAAKQARAGVGRRHPAGGASYV